MVPSTITRTATGPKYQHPTRLGPRTRRTRCGRAERTACCVAASGRQMTTPAAAIVDPTAAACDDGAGLPAGYAGTTKAGNIARRQPEATATRGAGRRGRTRSLASIVVPRSITCQPWRRPRAPFAPHMAHWRRLGDHTDPRPCASRSPALVATYLARGAQGAGQGAAWARSSTTLGRVDQCETRSRQRARFVSERKDRPATLPALALTVAETAAEAAAGAVASTGVEMEIRSSWAAGVGGWGKRRRLHTHSPCSRQWCGGCTRRVGSTGPRVLATRAADGRRRRRGGTGCGCGH